MSASTRQPINIDPEIRAALNRHLMSPKYMGTGVGFSEFIRRAILADGGVAPARVQPDNRWSGTYVPSNDTDGPEQENRFGIPATGEAVP
jgi:hypothetical protein